MLKTSHKKHIINHSKKASVCLVLAGLLTAKGQAAIGCDKHHTEHKEHTEKSTKQSNTVNPQNPNQFDQGKPVKYAGKNPLMAAAAKGDYDSAKQILQRSSAGLSFQDENGLTPLHIAAQNGNIWVVQLFVKSMNRDSLDKTSKEGTTPLQDAVRSGNQQASEMLISVGANTSRKYPNGQTLLQVAKEKSLNLKALKQTIKERKRLIKGSK